jgi:hypothetical protein
MKMQKRYEELAEELINAIPKDMTLYLRRRKGIILIIEREKRK